MPQNPYQSPQEPKAKPEPEREELEEPEQDASPARPVKGILVLGAIMAAMVTTLMVTPPENAFPVALFGVLLAVHIYVIAAIVKLVLRITSR